MPAWATWRDADRVGRFRSLGAGEHAALQCVRTGGNIAGLCEALNLALATAPHSRVSTEAQAGSWAFDLVKRELLRTSKKFQQNPQFKDTSI